MCQIKIISDEYFSEQCEGGPKNQSFWPTIKPFLTNKNLGNGNIMLCDNDEIVTDSISVANIFNKYFMEIADSIGFNDPIPSDFHSDHTLKAMIAKYHDHPSIKAIKNQWLNGMTFNFSYVTVNELLTIFSSLRKAFVIILF